MWSRPVAAIQPEAHRNAVTTTRRCAVPAPGFTLKNKARGQRPALAQEPTRSATPCPQRSGRPMFSVASARPVAQDKSRNVPTATRPKDPRRLEQPAIASRHTILTATIRIERHMVSHNGAQQGVPSHRTANGGALIPAHGQRPLARADIGCRGAPRARHTCRARRARIASTPRPGYGPGRALAQRKARRKDQSSAPASPSTAGAPSCVAAVPAPFALNTAGIQPVPSASRSASLAISPFLSLANRLT